MDKYTILREFADSWGLAAMFLFFVGVILYTFRPGSKAVHADAADIPLRHGDRLEDDAIANRNDNEPLKEART